MQTIAAIDVGSNAIRMVVGEVDTDWKVRVLDNIRLPVRLGQDVFTVGFIQEETVQDAIDAFLRFRRVADDFGVSRMRAIATSAMREASNGDFLVDRIANSTGIQIEIISGDEEARLAALAIAEAPRRRIEREIGDEPIDLCIGTGGHSVFLLKSRLTNERKRRYSSRSRPKQAPVCSSTRRKFAGVLTGVS